VPFTSEAITDNLEIVNDTPNDNATVEEITAGLADAINDTTTLVSGVPKGAYLMVIASDHEMEFTTTVTAGNMTVTTQDPNEATLIEILNGLRDAVNNSGENVVATIDAANNQVIVESAEAGTGYSIKLVEGSFSITPLVLNQVGITTLRLPENPSFGDKLTLKDMAYSFENKPLIVDPRGQLINGVNENLEVDVANAEVEFIYTGLDWRVS
jgi:hypothetical protein